MKQLSILDEIEIHDRENNSESEGFLNENRKRLSKQCVRVLQLLQSGIRLTTENAPGYRILSLPRRVKDLRDYNKIPVNDSWVRDENGRRLIKEYYL